MTAQTRRIIPRLVRINGATAFTHVLGAESVFQVGEQQQIFGNARRQQPLRAIEHHLQELRSVLVALQWTRARREFHWPVYATMNLEGFFSS